MPRWTLERRVSLAFLFALSLHAMGATWWIATRSSELTFHTTRLNHLEQMNNHDAESRERVIERLARIEERLDAQMILLSRIDKDMPHRTNR